MATYYPNSSNQGDVLPATYLREPKLASHPDLVPGYMMMYLNQASSAGAYSEFPIKGMAGNSLSPQNSVGIQSVGGENEFVYIPSTNDAISVQSISGHSNPANTNSSSATGRPITAPSTQLGSLDGGQNSQHQGLSLSLCTQITSADPMLSAYCHYSSPGMSMTSLLTNHVPMSVDGTSFKDYESSQSKNLGYVEYASYDFPRENHDAFKNKAFYSPQCSVNPIRIHSDPLLHESSVLENTICNSRYLKAAQQLLDEIVNVQMALKKPEKYQNINGKDLDASTEIDGRSGGLFSKNEMSSVQNDAAASGELSLVEQQDLQNKKIKLMSLVDEVDRRYKQYYHQMKIVISSLDSIAGFGAAKTYTELARITISRHFRCLRDAITGQIEVTQRSLGEQDNSPGIPRLCHVDQHFRKQRAIQQLGVMRHAWRPQRGLPETSVSILRAWLFEHFLHPYPKDSEKSMLARQTGLTRSQVANWFINARVRLWKPMVEEMYKEEFDDFDVNSKSHPENASIEPKDSSLKCKDRAVELQESLTSTAAGSSYAGHSSESKSDFIPDAERNGPTLRGGSQNCAPHQDDNLYFGVMTPVNGKRLNVDVCSLYLPDEFISANQSATGSNLAAAAADATYSVSGRADSQVSLALGLRHHEANVLTM